MADDRWLPSTPRPRRRRTDIDPNAPSPPVANERRRGRTWDAGEAPPPVRKTVDAPPEARTRPIPEPVPGDAIRTPSVATVPFHVPGIAAATLPERDEPVIDKPPTQVPADDRRSWLQVLDDRSPDSDICPFLRATGEHGLVGPIERPDTANRCAALAEAVPQSLRQQELVCLSTGHVNCPRYLRGAAVIAEAPTPVLRQERAMSPAMLGSLVVLVLALSASVGFVLARGGALDIGPTGTGPIGNLASASPRAAAAASPSAVASAPVVAPTATASVTPVPTPSVTPSPSPSPKPTPAAKPTPRATPRSDRYRLLRACPDAPRCWIYTVRRGDNVFSIARYFGVSQDSIYARNTWLRTRGLRAGQELRLPPPTR